LDFFILMDDARDGVDWTGGEEDALVREEPDEAWVPYDLEERTARFGEAIIDFAQVIPVNSVTTRLISQLVGCGTSVGANYCEANDHISARDFLHRVSTCRKEARETQYFLRMIVRARPELGDQGRQFWREARELNLIFSTIWRNGRKNLKNDIAGSE
jgi:four helix bundle protein